MRSRRSFLSTLATGGSSAALLGPWMPWTAAAAGPEARSAYRKWLLDVLPREDRTYDPLAHMLVSAADAAAGHHSTITSGSVHGTRPSLIYAVALLDTGESWRAQRAKDILQTVLPLQDTSPNSATYGLWPWYLEEPLARMSGPDPKWADYCGTQLLMVWLNHRERLGKPLAASVQEAIIHAARSIQKRNVPPSETGLAIAGTFVTLVAAQEFNLGDLRDYARARLRTLYTHITQHGSFDEYNSPISTVLIIQELSRMLRHVKDGRDATLVAPLHELAWKHVTTHFHPPTRQWAGPHSRCLETDLRQRPSVLAFLQAGSGGRANFNLGEPIPLSFEAAQVPLECPHRLARLLTALERPRQVRETFVRANPATPGAKEAVVGTTWLHPRVAIGSVNRGDLWAQRRPLVAYWGRAEQTAFLRARFLKDGRDFASALIFSAQFEGNVLSTVVLATDRGDSHPTLDPLKDGVFTARDLRLRLEFGGDLRDLVAKTITEGGRKVIQFMDPDIRYLVRPLAGQFDGAPVRWDEPELKTLSHIDAVFHQGDAKTFDLKKIPAAFTSFALQEWPYDVKQAPPAALEVTPLEGQARSYWKIDSFSLVVTGPTKPGPAAQLNDAFRVSMS